jgi:hypothetical protein
MQAEIINANNLPDDQEPRDESINFITTGEK